jgi:hypothetical protein
MNRLETLPESWDVERDTAFFTLTTHVFDAGFVAGAGVLLASYDEETPDVASVPAALGVPAPRRRHCTSSWV